MAGLLNNVVYVSDDGNSYVVTLDASNAAAGGFAAYDPVGSPHLNLPKGYRMRYIDCFRDATGSRRKIAIAASNNAKFVSGGTISIMDFKAIPPADADFQITFAGGEKRRFKKPGV